MQWLGVETARCDNHLGGRTQFVLFFARAPGAICILPIARSRNSQGLALILGIGSAEKVLASTSPAI